MERSNDRLAVQIVARPFSGTSRPISACLFRESDRPVLVRVRVGI